MILSQNNQLCPQPSQKMTSCIESQKNRKCARDCQYTILPNTILAYK